MAFKRLTSEAEVTSFILSLNTLPFTVLDLETTGLSEWDDTIVDIQLSCGEDIAIFGGEYAPLLAQLSTPLVGHHLKFDLKMLYRGGVDLTNLPWRDTLILGHLADENRDSYSLDSYVKDLWNDPYKEVFWSKNDSYQSAAPMDTMEYACKDVLYTHKLYLRLLYDLSSQGIPTSLVNHSHSLARTLLDTELTGLAVDTAYLSRLGKSLSKKIDALKGTLHHLVSDEVESIEMDRWLQEIAKRKTPRGKQGVERPVFSFDSTAQLQVLLYKHLKLPIQKNAKTKSISTDDASLQALKDLHPLIPVLQEYRESQKIMTAYIEGTIDRMRPDGRIYPTFNITGTATGRISHSNPNLGQLPAKGGVRGMYIPDEGCVLISADYSSLEVCLEAHLTQDPNLLKIVNEGLSKHDMTATALSIDRGKAKTLNFALQYWASHFKVATILGISKDEGKTVWDNYWKIYSGPKKLKQRTDYQVDKGIPLATQYGRKRRFPARSRKEWDGDYRQAYNFVIQSLGADITSEALYVVDSELRQRGWGKALFSVHDECLIQAKKEYEKEASELLVRVMGNVGKRLRLSVALKAECSGGMERWLD